MITEDGCEVLTAPLEDSPELEIHKIAREKKAEEAKSAAEKGDDAAEAIMKNG